MGQLQDKVAIVTGAARGLGRAYAEAMAGEGAAVFACDINPCDETVAAITGAGGRAAAAGALGRVGAKGVAVDRLHAKALVADDQAIVMTANLERHGLDRGCELGLILDVDETLELMEVLDRWTPRF